MTLWLLLCAHCLGDFTLQGSDWAVKKTQKLRYLLGHAAVYGAVLALAGLLAVPADVAALPGCVIIVSHFLIDWLRIRLDKRFLSPGAHLGSFLADQTLHVLIIWGCVAYLIPEGAVRPWVLTVDVTVVRYALLFLAILDPASVFVKKLSQYVSGESGGTAKKETPVGSVIGKLERLLIVILVLCDELGAIGFVLTAKSLARYKQLSERDFAEKYLVGTLASTAIAVSLALLLK